MAKKKAPKKRPKASSKKSDDAKLFAFLATFLSIVGFLIALIAKKDDKYVMHYAKQSLMVFIVFIAGWVIMIIPFIGWVIGWVIHIIGLVLWVISWIYALSGEMKEVPIVGQYGRNFDL